MARLVIALFALLLAALAVLRPEDIPRTHQPWSPIDLTAEPGFVSRWKLRVSFPAGICRTALAEAKAGAPAAPERIESAQCHIRGGVRLSRLSAARLAPVDMRCAVAARLYLWERHSLQQAAQDLLGASVSRIRHYSSYSCRPIRTTSGRTRRMSEHSTANAFDISGFVLSDGREISLTSGWDGSPSQRAFLRAARDGLCDWFNVVLSPDYNALHADHFHVDMGPFQTCR